MPGGLGGPTQYSILNTVPLDPNPRPLNIIGSGQRCWQICQGALVGPLNTQYSILDPGTLPRDIPASWLNCLRERFFLYLYFYICIIYLLYFFCIPLSLFLGIPLFPDLYLYVASIYTIMYFLRLWKSGRAEADFVGGISIYYLLFQQMKFREGKGWFCRRNINL